MIAAGSLKYILKFKKLEEIQSESGFVTKSKVDLFTTRAAKVKTSGKFEMNSKELFHSENLKFKLRYNKLLSDDLIVSYDNNEYNISFLDKNEFDNTATITLEKNQQLKMEIKVKVSDINRILKVVENLSDVDKDNVIKQGLRTATNMFLAAGRRNLRARLKNKKGVTGNLLKSFKNKVKRRQLGALGGFGQLGNHSHLVDQGTKERFTKSGKPTGKMPANHFWSAAISSTQNQAMNEVYKGIDRGITRIINRS